MGVRHCCHCYSLRFLLIITLCVILARCFLEITVTRSEIFRNTQRLRSPEGKLKDPVVGNADPVLNVKSSSGLKGVVGDFSKSVGCKTGLKLKTAHLLSQITTDWNIWTYKRQASCPRLLLDSTQLLQSSPSIYINCKISQDEVYASTDTTNDVQTLPFGSACLDAYIRTCCSTDKMPVPNIVHYIWYGKGHTFSFYGLLSFISVIRFVRPCAILVHGNTLPSGLYWNFVLNLYPKIIHVTRKIQAQIYGKKPKHRNHFSDIIRIEALLRYGGIYLDMDMVLVKDIDFLRKYPCTMSRMRSHLLASSFIMAMKNATFLQKWLDGYKYHYRNDSYIYSAMNYPSQLSYNYTHLIHVELETLSRPWSQHGDRIYYTNFDWSKLYGIHLYNRLFKVHVNESVVRQMNTTFGAISRHILYGNKELCLS